MPPLLRWIAILCLLASPGARAADLPGPWVEFASDGGIDIRAITAPGMPCPRVVVDGAATPSRTRGQPDAAAGPYTVQVCVAHAATQPRTATVDGVPMPVPPATIKRIVVIGGTGCRLKGTFVQDCNDPMKWPFATVARLAAARRPDLVIHIGDYHYRETPCPADRPGCAGSPYGDNWAVWQKDFFDPAAPLLAAAPWVMVRGNHEICSRGGHGWFRLLDPHPDAVECTATTAPYALHIDTLNLLIFDGADADDRNVEPGKVAVYREQLQTLLANAPAHSWLLTHYPVWALVEGEGTRQGDTLNATQQAAIRGLIPVGLDMILSGHAHDFTSYDFGAERPSQLIIGESGDAGSAIVQPVTAGITLDGMRVRRAFAMSDWGYVVLHRVSAGWAAAVYAIDDRVLARCSLRGRNLTCHSVAQ
jgi:calcineurin-like phosphoesterase family protein